MKFSTGKMARAIRRREVSARLLQIISVAAFDDPTFMDEARQLILEINEIATINANQNTRPRKRT